MVTDLAFKVMDWRAWTPGRESRKSWQDWAGGNESGIADTWPAPRALPMMLRRRAGWLGQKAIEMAIGCGDADQSRYIFASRHGELGRTAEILAAMAAGESPSPTEFSMSVHHALAGILSIYAGNRQGHTAVAAGIDTFGCGFLEAVACAAESPDRSTLLVYYDAPLPEEYAVLDRAADAPPLALAVQFGTADADRPRYHFAAIPAENTREAGSARADTAAYDFLRFLLTDVEVAVSAGDRMDWRWQRGLQEH